MKDFFFSGIIICQLFPSFNCVLMKSKTPLHCKSITLHHGLFCLMFFFILFSILFSGAYSQTRTIDSLKKQVEAAADPAKKLQAIFAFCEQRQSLNTDTLCRYASEAARLSMNASLSDQVMAEYYMASCLVKRGEMEDAIQVCETNLSKVSGKNFNPSLIMKLRTLKGQALIRSNKFKEGLAEVYQVLILAEQNRDTLMQIIARNGIGWANMEMNQTPQALKWFFQALNTSGNISYYEKNSNIYSNIAAIYKAINKYDSAEYYVKKSIAFARKSENLFFLANSLNVLADIYNNTKRSEQAEALLTEALEYRKVIGDPYYIVSDISELGIYYASISQPAKGIAICLQGIEIAEKIQLVSKLPFLYHALGQNFKVAGNYRDYSKTLEKLIAYQDSTAIENSAEARAELYTKYELQKKENLIILQKLDLSRKNSMVYGVSVLLFFTAFISWALIRGNRKNQQIRLLKMQAQERQLAARAVLTAEEKERKRIARDLHDNIGAYATVLMANTEHLNRHSMGEEARTYTESVTDNARQIMGSLQETIWVLNNEVIKVTDFIDRFKLYSTKILRNFPGIQLRFHENIMIDYELSPAEALHIFRIMQEALQNTIKHSGAGYIHVSVESDKDIVVSIKDDGKGFDKNDKSGGNGISNMRHRAGEAGYSLDINSGGEGTEIILKKIMHLQYCNST
jgi:signal transduction histidine kinase